MTLEEYVAQTLIEITKGVARAQEEALLYVAPGYVDGIRQDQPQTVTLEVATTVSHEGGGRISVLSFVDANGSTSSQSMNRVTFDVPVYFTAPTIKNRRHPKNDGPMDPIDHLLDETKAGRTA